MRLIYSLVFGSADANTNETGRSIMRLLVSTLSRRA